MPGDARFSGGDGREVESSWLTGFSAKLPWLTGTGDSAATALRAAGLPGVDGIDAREAFTRK